MKLLAKLSSNFANEGDENQSKDAPPTMTLSSTLRDDSTSEGTKIVPRKRCVPFKSGIRVALDYVAVDSLRRWRSTLLNLLVLVLVVFSITALRGVFSKTAAFTLRLSEKAAGEIDVDILLDVERESSLNNSKSDVRIPVQHDAINFFLPGSKMEAAIRNAFKGNDELAGVTSRTYVSAIASKNEATGASNVKSRVTLAAYDDRAERAADIGRTWDLRRLGPQQAYVSEDVLTFLGTDTGDMIVVSINFKEQLDLFGVTTGDFIASFADTTKQGNTTYVVIDLPNRSVVHVPLDTAASELDSSGVLEDLHALLKIVGSIENADGKWPSDVGNVVAIESTKATSLILEMLKNARADYLAQKVVIDCATQNPQSNGFVANCVLPQLVGQWTPTKNGLPKEFRQDSLATEVFMQYNDRIKLYLGNLDVAKNRLRGFSDRASSALGVDFPVKFQLGVLNLMIEQRFLILLVEQIFLTIFITILMLGSILIYSLASIEVEQRGYEFAMMRTLGLHKMSLISILVLRGLRSLPGMFLGLALGYFALLLVQVIITSVTSVPVTQTMDVTTIVLAVLVGTLVPLVSNVLPVRRALTNSLKVAIDTSRHTMSEVKVVVRRVKSLGIVWWQIVLALILFVYGAVFFYVLPPAFVNNKYSVFFSVLNLALLGVLLGLSILVQVLQPPFEVALLYVLIPPLGKWRDRKLRPMARRQLYTHRKRNRLVEIMITVGLSFVIFAGAMVLQQIEGFQTIAEDTNGCDVLVQSLSNNVFLDEDALAATMSDMRKRGQVDDFSFVTSPRVVSSLLQITDYPSLQGQYMYGIQPNFFNVILPGRTEISSTAAPYENVQDLAPLLNESSGRVPENFGGESYDDQLTPIISGEGTIFADQNADIDTPGASAQPLYMMVATALDQSIGVSVDIPFAIQFGRRFLIRATIMASKVPGFSMGKYGYSAQESALFISNENFRDLLSLAPDVNNTYPNLQSTGQLPMSRMLVKLAGEGRQRIDNNVAVVNTLRSVLNDSIQVSDTVTAVNSTTSVQRGIYWYFVIVAIVADVLCFIMLWSTMTTNARENAWEFAVLRAVGLTKKQLVRVYLYESLAMVTSSIILGTGSGIVISTALALQYKVFTESNFTLKFPWLMYIILVGLALISAMIAPIVALRRLFRKEVAHVLRSIDD